MKNKLLLIGLGISLAACHSGLGGFANTPVLKEGQTIIWHYNCQGGNGLDVEYAQMGGGYSATLILPAEAGKKTLLQQAPNDFRLETYRWQSADGRFFNLSHDGVMIQQQCLGMNIAEPDAIRKMRKLDELKE